MKRAVFLCQKITHRTRYVFWCHLWEFCIHAHVLTHTLRNVCTGKTSIKRNTAGEMRDGEFQAKIEDF